MTFPLTDPGDIDRLAADLRHANYTADGVLELLGESANQELGRGHVWAALHMTRTSTQRVLATLVEIFLLHQPVTQAAARAAFSHLGIAAAIASGVLCPAEDKDDMLRAAIDIRPYADNTRSYWVVSDIDGAIGPTQSNYVLGVGAASLSLARAVVRQPVERALDIGTGCGIQAIHCASHTRQIVATDTNKRALAMAAATARLNGMSWDVRHGSLFEPVAGERFDLIVSNPPFVISPAIDRFEYRDSGMVGDEICRQLITQLPDYLAPGGTAQLLANWLIYDETDWRMRVGSWVAETGLDGWVVQRDVADPVQYVSMWLADASGTWDTDMAAKTELASQWLEYFAAENVSGIGMGTVSLRRPDGPRISSPDVVFDELLGAGDQLTGQEVAAFLARRRYVTSRSDTDLLATRFAQAEGNLLQQQCVPTPDGFAPVMRMLYRPSGPGATVQLDQWGQSLLAGCQGALSLHTLIEMLAGAHQLDPAAFTAAMMPTVRSAITRGLLHPVEED